MDESPVMVSVCCTVFNHEKYLRRCLDGIVMQKTNFRFEAIVNDDASTDGSADIIREYAQKYPDIIKPVFHAENQYSKGLNIWWDVSFPALRGRYFATCEGDDFWTDPTKLQRQFDVTEQNPDAVFCVHQVRDVAESGEPLDHIHPDEPDVPEKMTGDEWLCFIMEHWAQFQTTSYFGRTDVLRKFIGNVPEFVSAASVGDVILQMLFSQEGSLCYIPREMSCYRVNSIGSWTATTNADPQLDLKHCEKMCRSLALYDEYTGGKFSDVLDKRSAYFEVYVHEIKGHYAELTKPKFAEYFRRYSFKYRLYCRLWAAFPRLMKAYASRRNQK